MNSLRTALPLIVSLFASGLLTCSGNGPVTGGGSNTGNANTLAGIIREPDGRTPARCNAYLYHADALPVAAHSQDTNILSTTATDTAGRFYFSDIADGAYNIYCTDRAKFYSTLILGNMVTGNDSQFIGEDTLRSIGSLSGRVTNAGGMPAIAFIYGSPFITEINDTSGFFFLDNLPTRKNLPIIFMTREGIGGKQCDGHYQFNTLPDTTLFITITLECDSAGNVLRGDQ